MRRLFDLARGLREQLGLQGYPSLEDAERICELSGDRLEIRARPIRKAYLYQREDGSAVITVPSRLTVRERALVLVEEYGHWALISGAVAEGNLRLGRKADRREERIACAFSIIWRCFPASQCWDDQQALEDGGGLFDADELRTFRRLCVSM